MWYKDYGFVDYQSYLASPYWQKTKQRYLKANQPRYCYICDTRKNLNLHHETYERLGVEDVFSDLVCLCRPCHHAVHFQEDGTLTPKTKKALQERRKLLRKRYILQYVRPSTLIPFLLQSLYRIFW